MSLAAIERHRGAGLQRFVTLAAERERHFPLAIELKAAVVELALQQHVAEHRAQLLVAQTMSLERPALAISVLAISVSFEGMVDYAMVPTLGIDIL